jgi:hypothetical protein
MLAVTTKARPRGVLGTSFNPFERSVRVHPLRRKASRAPGPANCARYGPLIGNGNG